MHRFSVISFYTSAHAMLYVFFHFGPIEVFKITLVVFSPQCPTIGMSCTSSMTLMHNFPSNTYTTYFHFGNLSRKVKPFTLLLFATPQSSYGKRSFTYPFFFVFKVIFGYKHGMKYSSCFRRWLSLIFFLSIQCIKHHVYFCSIYGTTLCQ
jgi:hypothetical protein